MNKWKKIIDLMSIGLIIFGITIIIYGIIKFSFRWYKRDYFYFRLFVMYNNIDFYVIGYTSINLYFLY